MNLKLIKASYEYQDELTEMIKEWKHDQEVNHTDRSPWAIFKNDIEDFDYYLENLECKEDKNGYVPDSTFFCLDVDRNRIVGAVNIRHYLNENIYLTGGHIGDGIRPSERKKGYATAMIALALKECKKLGINKVLMTCNKENIGSAKSIMNNGGVLESEIGEDGEIEQRYWINLKEETVESKRFVMRRVMPYDYREMAAWTLDERVYTYLLGNPVKKPEDIMNFSRRKDPNSKTNYVMIVRQKEDGHAVGIIGAVYEPEHNAWEMSYSIRYDDWGKNCATEATQALMDYIEKEHGTSNFMGECAKENIGSAKVLQKLGMVYDHDSSYTKHDGSRTFESAVYVLRKQK